MKTFEALGFTIAPATAEETRAWLVTTKSDYRRLGGSTKYDDDPTSHYSYDSNVANSLQVAVGDRLVFWDEESLIGASTVASIDQRPGTTPQPMPSLLQRRTLQHARPSHRVSAAMTATPSLRLPSSTRLR